MTGNEEIKSVEGNEIREEENPGDDLHPIERTLESMHAHFSLLNLEALVVLDEFFFAEIIGSASELALLADLLNSSSLIEGNNLSFLFFISFFKYLSFLTHHFLRLSVTFF